MEPLRKRQKLDETVTVEQAEATIQASSSRHQHHESRQSDSTGVQNQNGNILTGRDFIINNFAKTNDPSDHRQSLLESLRFDQIDARQSTIKKAYTNTCRWFLKNPLYKQWERKDPSQDDDHFLWIKGKPGAGKSTLMKYLHQQILKKGDGITISFFFNARGEDLEKSTIGLYRSLLLQLLEKRPDLQHVLDTSRPGRDWNVESLKTLFEEALPDLGQTPLTCVIDALDECEEQDVRDMVNFLSELVGTDTSRLYICFASRHYPYITLESSLDVVLEEQDKHQDDIATYLKGSLRIGKGKIAEQIRSEVREKASGVFMWVVLVVDILNKESDAGRSFALRERLQQLPPNLHGLFRDILTRDTNHQEALLLCIQWVLLSKRPLTPKELYFAIVSGYEPQHLSDCHSNEISDEDVYKYILNNSKGLVDSTKSKKSTIQFIHESVRDFLLKAGGLGEIFPSIGSNVHGQGHEALKNCCITYMNMEIAPEIQKLAQEKVQQKLPFLDYAIHGVLHHAEKAEAAGLSQSRLTIEFPRQDWIKWYNLLKKQKSRHYTPSASLLYILAESNAAALIPAHQSHQFFDVEDERYGLPILAATATKSVAAVQVILKFQAAKMPKFPSAYFQSLAPSDLDAFFSIPSRDWNFNKKQETIPQLLRYSSEGLLLFLFLADYCSIESKDDKGRRLLESTVERGYIILLRELLKKSPEAITDNAMATDLLILATQQPNPEVAELLIKFGADVTNVDKEGCTPLHKTRHGAVARLLIDRGVGVSISDQDGKTSLQHAIERGNAEVVKTLIERGSNLLATDHVGRTPLHKACQNLNRWDSKRIRLAKLLAERGVGTLIADQDGKTPLHHASHTYGSAEAVISLIKGGSDIQGVDHQGATPLHLACSMSEGFKAVKLLLQHGANVSAVDKDGRSPLHLARDGSIAKALIENGADVSAVDKDGRTPLHLKTWSFRMAETLIKSGADVSAVDKDGKTPLHLARDASIAKALIENSADVSAVDNDGKTPLHLVQDTSIAETLIKSGADVSAVDKDGRTPLHLARDASMAKALIKSGAEVSAVDNDGKTPLHLARNWSIAEALLKSGVDISAVDKHGKTPLFYAQKNYRVQAELTAGDIVHANLVDILMQHGGR